MKKIKQIVSVAVAFLFFVNNISFGLGIPVGVQQARMGKEAKMRHFAANNGPGAFVDTLAWHHVKPENFIGKEPDIPGVSYVEVDYDNPPEGWEKNPILLETDLKKALEYYRDNEAGIPEKELEIEEGWFEVEDGAFPFYAIEHVGDDKGIEHRRLIIHTEFRQKWAHLRKNDIWYKTTLPNGEERIVSLAWSIFYRISKHAMTDLEKDSFIPKAKNASGEPVRSHITATESGAMAVHRDEAAANMIGGNYYEQNEAGWMVALAAYLFKNFTRYNSAAFRDRLNWYFDKEDADAQELRLYEEFPRLIGEENREKRERVIDLACWIHYQFFTQRRPDGTLIEPPKTEVDPDYIRDWNRRKDKFTQPPIFATGKDEPSPSTSRRTDRRVLSEADMASMGRVTNIEYNGSGYAAVLNAKKRLWLFDAEGNMVFEALNARRGFALTGTHLVTVSESGRLTLHDINTEDVIFEYKEHNPWRGFVLTNTHLATANNSGWVTIFNINKKKIVPTTLRTSEKLVLMDTHLVTVNERGRLILYDINTEDVIFKDKDLDARRGFALTGTHLATVSARGYLTLHDINTKDVIFEDKDLDAWRGFALTGTHLATVSACDYLTLHDINTKDVIFEDLDARRDFALTGTHLATVSGRGRLTLHDINTKDVIFEDLDARRDFALTGTHLATVSVRGRLTLDDIHTKSVIVKECDAWGGFDLTATYLATVSNINVCTLHDIKTGDIIIPENILTVLGQHRAQTKGRGRPGKSPEDLLTLIGTYVKKAEILTAPILLGLYQEHWGKLGFEAPAKNGKSALRTIERDLFESPKSLLNQELVKEMPTRGANNARQFKITGKGKKEAGIRVLINKLRRAAKNYDWDAAEQYSIELKRVAGHSAAPIFAKVLMPACGWSFVASLSEKLCGIAGKDEATILAEKLVNAIIMEELKAVTSLSKALKSIGKPAVPAIIEVLRKYANMDKWYAFPQLAKVLEGIAGKQELPTLVRFLKKVARMQKPDFDHYESFSPEKIAPTLVRNTVDGLSEVLQSIGKPAAPAMMEVLLYAARTKKWPVVLTLARALKGIAGKAEASNLAMALTKAANAGKSYAVEALAETLNSIGKPAVPAIVAELFLKRSKYAVPSRNLNFALEGLTKALQGIAGKEEVPMLWEALDKAERTGQLEVAYTLVVILRLILVPYPNPTKGRDGAGDLLPGEERQDGERLEPIGPSTCGKSVLIVGQSAIAMGMLETQFSNRGIVFGTANNFVAEKATYDKILINPNGNPYDLVVIVRGIFQQNVRKFEDGLKQREMPFITVGIDKVLRASEAVAREVQNALIIIERYIAGLLRTGTTAAHQEITEYISTHPAVAPFTDRPSIDDRLLQEMNLDTLGPVADAIIENMEEGGRAYLASEVPGVILQILYHLGVEEPGAEAKAPASDAAQAARVIDEEGISMAIKAVEANKLRNAILLEVALEVEGALARAKIEGQKHYLVDINRALAIKGLEPQARAALEGMEMGIRARATDGANYECTFSCYPHYTENAVYVFVKETDFSRVRNAADAAKSGKSVTVMLPVSQASAIERLKALPMDRIPRGNVVIVHNDQSLSGELASDFKIQSFTTTEVDLQDRFKAIVESLDPSRDLVIAVVNSEIDGYALAEQYPDLRFVLITEISIAERPALTNIRLTATSQAAFGQRAEFVRHIGDILNSEALPDEDAPAAAGEFGSGENEVDIQFLKIVENSHFAKQEYAQVESLVNNAIRLLREVDIDRKDASGFPIADMVNQVTVAIKVLRRLEKEASGLFSDDMKTLLACLEHDINGQNLKTLLRSVMQELRDAAIVILSDKEVRELGGFALTTVGDNAIGINIMNPITGEEGLAFVLQKRDTDAELFHVSVLFEDSEDAIDMATENRNQIVNIAADVLGRLKQRSLWQVWLDAVRAATAAAEAPASDAVQAATAEPVPKRQVDVFFVRNVILAPTQDGVNRLADTVADNNADTVLRRECATALKRIARYCASAITEHAVGRLTNTLIESNANMDLRYLCAGALRSISTYASSKMTKRAIDSLADTLADSTLDTELRNVCAGALWNFCLEITENAIIKLVDTLADKKTDPKLRQTCAYALEKASENAHLKITEGAITKLAAISTDNTANAVLKETCVRTLKAISKNVLSEIAAYANKIANRQETTNFLGKEISCERLIKVINTIWAGVSSREGMHSWPVTLYTQETTVPAINQGLALDIEFVAGKMADAVGGLYVTGGPAAENSYVVKLRRKVFTWITRGEDRKQADMKAWLVQTSRELAKKYAWLGDKLTPLRQIVIASIKDAFSDPSEDKVKKLVDTLADNDADMVLRLECAKALKNISEYNHSKITAYAINSLARTLADNDADMRLKWACSFVLCKIAKYAPSEITEHTVDKLADTFSNDTVDIELRKQCALTLCNVPSKITEYAVEKLVDVAVDTNVEFWLRRDCADVLFLISKEAPSAITEDVVGRLFHFAANNNANVQLRNTCIDVLRRLQVISSENLKALLKPAVQELRDAAIVILSDKEVQKLGAVAEVINANTIVITIPDPITTGGRHRFFLTNVIGNSEPYAVESIYLAPNETFTNITSANSGEALKRAAAFELASLKERASWQRWLDAVRPTTKEALSFDQQIAVAKRFLRDNNIAEERLTVDKTRQTLELYLGGIVRVSDINALRGLTSLTVLNLSDTRVSDISALRGLVNLTMLDLSSTRVFDIGALRGLTNLTGLHLFGCTRVYDISALGGLANLAILNLGKTRVSDISTLRGLTNLTKLCLTANTKISDEQIWDFLRWHPNRKNLTVINSEGVEMRLGNISSKAPAAAQAAKATGKTSSALDRSYVEVLTIYAIQIGLDVGPDSKEELTADEQKEVWEAVNTLHASEQKMEVLFAQRFRLTKDTQEAIKNMDGNREKNFVDPRKYSDIKHLEKLLELAAGTDDGVKRIVITENGDKEALRSLVGRRPGLFKNVRLINFTLPDNYDGLDTDGRTYYQAKIFMIAILARLLNGNDTPMIEAVLKGMLQSSLGMDGKNLEDFMNELGRPDTGKNLTDKELKELTNRMLYFLKNAVSLVEKCAKEFFLKLEFYTYA